MTADTGNEPGLQFPLDWQGKVLAQADAGDVPGQIGEAMRALGLAAVTTPGNRSAQGRYLTYTVQAVIPDRETLQQAYYALSHIAGVRYVL
jgi:putative lipoic acid-binding regulatory protein